MFKNISDKWSSPLQKCWGFFILQRKYVVIMKHTYLGSRRSSSNLIFPTLLPRLMVKTSGFELDYRGSNPRGASYGVIMLMVSKWTVNPLISVRF